MQGQTYICAECPWLVNNHGRRTPSGRYTRKSLTLMWNRVRRGAGQQVCEAGTEEASRLNNTHPAPQVECPASIALVYRELAKLYSIVGSTASPTPAQVQRYIDLNPDGLTRAGINHWTTLRPKMPPQLGGTPIPPIPRAIVLDMENINRPRQ